MSQFNWQLFFAGKKTLKGMMAAAISTMMYYIVVAFAANNIDDSHLWFAIAFLCILVLIYWLHNVIASKIIMPDVEVGSGQTEEG